MKTINGIEYYKLEEVAEMLNINYQKVYKAVRLDHEYKKRGDNGFLTVEPFVEKNRRFYTLANIEVLREEIKDIAKYPTLGTVFETPQYACKIRELKEKNAELEAEIIAYKKMVEIYKQIIPEIKEAI